MNAPDLVQELGSRLNLTGLTLSDGVCRLVFDRSLLIDIEDDGDGNLTFHSVIGSLPHSGRETVLRSLMSAHLFGLDTGGATFGLHPATDEVYLFRLQPADGLQVEDALKTLERFTQQVERWKLRAEELIREAGATPSADTVIETGSLRA